MRTTTHSAKVTSKLSKSGSVQPGRPAHIILGLVIVAGLALLAWWLTKQAAARLGDTGKALEYPLWGVLVGLGGNLILRGIGLRDRLQPAIRTELFLKVGLVLLGASISFQTLVRSASAALIQAPIMIVAVFFFAWWLGGKLGLDQKLRAVIATAISICGVSAAIAAAGAVLARKEQTAYVTTLVILVALPMMVLAPLAAGALHLPEAVAGAWFGGNIDTTAAVVGAGTLYGEQAVQTATIVKTTQNALIGVATFLLALYFSTVVERRPGERPSAHLIWDRFPKFVLGFLLASILNSLGLIDGSKGSTIDALTRWAFLLAFVCMGLDFSFAALREQGWRPVTVFLVTTLFNTLLALGLAWLLFGVWFAG